MCSAVLLCEASGTRQPHPAVGRSTSHNKETDFPVDSWPPLLALPHCSG